MNPYSVYFIKWYKGEHGKAPDPNSAETQKLYQAYKAGYEEGRDEGHNEATEHA